MSSVLLQFARLVPESTVSGGDVSDHESYGGGPEHGRFVTLSEEVLAAGSRQKEKGPSTLPPSLLYVQTPYYSAQLLFFNFF